MICATPRATIKTETALLLLSTTVRMAAVDIERNAEDPMTLISTTADSFKDNACVPAKIKFIPKNKKLNPINASPKFL